MLAAGGGDFSVSLPKDVANIDRPASCIPSGGGFADSTRGIPVGKRRTNDKNILKET